MTGRQAEGRRAAISSVAGHACPQRYLGARCLPTWLRAGRKRAEPALVKRGVMTSAGTSAFTWHASCASLRRPIRAFGLLATARRPGASLQPQRRRWDAALLTSRRCAECRAGLAHGVLASLPRRSGRSERSAPAAAVSSSSARTAGPSSGACRQINGNGAFAREPQGNRRADAAAPR
ncbi:hypothetical protein FQR65_LT20126 [Abscondita terminalis]|nr:hypothetical protein FQR65_LT20126 [Abscondita terminalis]